MRYEVILDEGETANKCTIAPLSYRQDFKLLRVKSDKPLGPLTANIILHHQGKCLLRMKSQTETLGLAAIDCVWKRLNTLLSRIQGTLPVLGRIPDGFETAYPRRSKQMTDPDTGLATIEAIFVATAILKKWDPTLLSEYYFGRKFVELNRKRFLELGISEAGCDEKLPVYNVRPKNSMQRRRDRSKHPFHPKS
jgi:ribosome biogenesis protein Tsr3